MKVYAKVLLFFQAQAVTFLSFRVKGQSSDSCYQREQGSMLS